MGYNSYANIETGEIIEGVMIEKDVFERRIHETEKYYERKSKVLKNAKYFIDKKSEQTDLIKYMNLNLGSFFFNNYTNMFKKLGYDSALSFRFIYLCTFSDYDGVLRFGSYKNNVHHDFMQEKDLKEVMNLSVNMITAFKKDIYRYGLVEKVNDTLVVNKLYCSRGTQMKKSLQNSTRVFDDEIRKLYESSKATQHKKIGLLFTILPYVNKTHNVICLNPEERDIFKVKPVSNIQLCEIVGQEISNGSRIKKDLTNIKIDDQLCVLSAEGGGNSHLYINPRIYYSGTELYRLESLCNMFDALSSC